MPDVVVTDGPHGAFVRYGGAEAHVPAFPCEPGDLTGAGDMFAGAFLYGITHGVAPAKAARAANFLAMKVITQVGARLHHGARRVLGRGAQGGVRGATWPACGRSSASKSAATSERTRRRLQQTLAPDRGGRELGAVREHARHAVVPRRGGRPRAARRLPGDGRRGGRRTAVRAACVWGGGVPEPRGGRRWCGPGSPTVPPSWSGSTRLLESPLLDLGCYRREDRPYTPHLTLGRVKSEADGQALAPALVKSADWTGGRTTVGEVVLFAQRPAAGGAGLHGAGPRQTGRRSLTCAPRGVWNNPTDAPVAQLDRASAF